MELDRIRVLEPRKGNNHESKEPAYSMGNIFTSYTLDRGLATKTYKELQKLNTIKANHPINKWTEYIVLKIRKKDDQLIFQNVFNILNPQGNVIKRILRFTLTPLRRASTKKANENEHRPGCGVRE